MVMSYFWRRRPDCKIESFYTTGTQKKIDCFKADSFCAHCNTVFKAIGCFYHYCPCQEARPSLTEEDIERGKKEKWTRWESSTSKKKDIMFLKCGNTIDGIYMRRKRMLKNNWENQFLANVHWENRDCWSKKEAVNCLVMYNVILKCLMSSRRVLLIFHPFSKIQTVVDMILGYWWRLRWERRTSMSTTENVDFCQAFSLKRELSLLICSYFFETCD